MRIAFINQPWNPVIPPVNRGSIAIWTYEVASRLAAAGHQVIVYSMRSPAQPRHDRIEGIEYRRFSVRTDQWVQRMLKHVSRRVGALPGTRHPLVGWPGYYLAYIGQVALDIRKWKADIVHLHNFSQFVPVVRALNRRAKIVLHMHCEWLGQLDEEKLKLRLVHADLVAGCSRYITAIAERRFPSIPVRHDTIYNGVNPEVFFPPAGSPKGSIAILYVGRVSPEKGLHILIRSFGKLDTTCAPAHLEIIGPDSVTPRDFLVGLNHKPDIESLDCFYSGDYTEQLHKMIEELVPASRRALISFTGSVPHAQTADRYRRASLLANPSLSEAFGMSLIEGMACGVPVVATRVGGMVEVVEDGKTGLLVEPNDAQALADAFLELAGDPERRAAMGRAGRERAIQRFSWEQVTRRLIEQYREI